MNPSATSPEAILETCREILRCGGNGELTVRGVANACGVSVGCVYNYFPSKGDLLAAAVESVWAETLPLHEVPQPLSLAGCTRWIFERLAQCEKEYPGFLRGHAAHFADAERTGGKARMECAWAAARDLLKAAAEEDPAVRAGAFTDAFTADTLADLLFALMLAALFTDRFDSGLALEMIRRTVY